jgi:hypothetical protein
MLDKVGFMLRAVCLPVQSDSMLLPAVIATLRLLLVGRGLPLIRPVGRVRIDLGIRPRNWPRDFTAVVAIDTVVAGVPTVLEAARRRMTGAVAGR